VDGQTILIIISERHARLENREKVADGASLHALFKSQPSITAGKRVLADYGRERGGGRLDGVQHAKVLSVGIATLSTWWYL
jgi:hypothetical protein